MKKKTIRKVSPIFICGVIWLLLYSASETHAQEKSLLILYSGSSNGILANCGCPKDPLGAMEKRAALIKQLRLKHDNVLLLDSGDLMSSAGNALKDSFAIEAVESMRYDLLNVGDQEFSNGVDFFKRMKSQHEMPFMSTNLKIDGNSVSPAYLLKEVDGIKVSLIGLIAPSTFKFFDKDKIVGVEIESPRESLRILIPEVKTVSDLIILLSHAGFEEDKLFAEEFPEIDLIVGGHSQTYLEKPVLINKTLIVQAGHSGFYLGYIELYLSESSSILDYDGRLIPLTFDMGNDPYISSLIREYEKIISSDVKMVGSYIKPIPNKFIVSTSELCQKCHEEEYNQWKSTAHANAFEALVSVNKEQNQECLSCHTTGFGRGDGYYSKGKTAFLRNIHCTECHQISLDHLRSPEEPLFKEIDEKSCIRCHTISNSPTFKYGSHIEEVNHTNDLMHSSATNEENLIPQEINHLVINGESLSLISFNILGSINLWPHIYQANINSITDPDLIYPGQELVIQYSK